MNRCIYDNNAYEERCLPNCHSNCNCVGRIEERKICMPSYCNKEERGEGYFEGYVRICPKQNRQYNCGCNHNNSNGCFGNW